MCRGESLNTAKYAIDNDKNEISIDRNIETNERYKNIFELRHIKNKFLVEKMPTLVKNYCLITYDNLIENFVDVMNKMKDYNLPIKSNVNFPLNIHYYKKNVNETFCKKKHGFDYLGLWGEILRFPKNYLVIGTYLELIYSFGNGDFIMRTCTKCELKAITWHC